MEQPSPSGREPQSELRCVGPLDEERVLAESLLEDAYLIQCSGECAEGPTARGAVRGGGRSGVCG